MVGIIIILVILLLLALAAWLIMPRVAAKPDAAPVLCDYAHRGLFDNKTLPENSLGAYRAAMEHGFGIELDVQLTADGEVVVFHDYTLTRMCGKNEKITDLTLAALRKERLLGTEYTVPTLREVLKLVNGRVPLLIELKGESTDDSLCWVLAPILDSYAGDYCIESFNPMLLRWFKRHRPDVVRGQLVTNLMKEKREGNRVLNFALSHLLLNLLSRPDFIACNGRFQRDFVVWLCHTVFGAPLFLWTVRHPEAMQINRRHGIFSIFEGFVPKR